MSVSMLDACIELRRAVMRFRPQTDRDLDTARVREHLSRATDVFMIHDRGGELVAFGDLHVHEPQGPPGPVVYEIMYGYARHSIRGSPQIIRLLLVATLLAMWRGMGRECWLIGVGAYPPSYRLAIRHGRFAGHSLDPRLPASLRRWIEQLAAERHGADWDLHRHIVRLPTLPPPMSLGPRASTRGGWLREYERICPNWREGWGLVFFVRLRARDLLGTTAGMVNRWLFPRR